MSESTGNHARCWGLFPGLQTPRLYDRVVKALRAEHYSDRTEEDLPPLDSPVSRVLQ
jgi:hypothetical protein